MTEAPPERVKIEGRRGVCMNGRFLGCNRIFVPEISILPLVIPGWQIVTLFGKRAKNSPTSASCVGSGTSTVSFTSQESCCQGIKHYFFIGVIGMKCSDHTCNGIIEKSGADAYGYRKLEFLFGGEERFVPADDFSLVIKNGPATRNPSLLQSPGRLPQAVPARPALFSGFLCQIRPNTKTRSAPWCFWPAPRSVTCVSRIRL